MGKINKPWGYYRDIETGDNYKIKMLCVHGLKRSSLQFHEHRSEYWVVVAGEITAILEEQEINLKTGDRLYIPVRVMHRIENRKHDVAEIVEIQYGDCNEDDIIRVADDYFRA